MLQALVCPLCKGNLSTLQETLVCQNCGQNYQTQENIPLLSKDPETLIKEVKQKIEQNPDWFLDDQIKFNDQSYYQHHRKKRLDYILNILKSHKGQKLKLLDAGCGDGTLLWHLIRFEGFEVYGIDYNLLRLMKAKRVSNNKVQLVMGSLLEQCYKDNYFDIIICNHVLEHLKDDYQVLTNLYQRLKPKGLFILGIPNEGAGFWQLRNKILQLLSPPMQYSTDHVHFYTVSQVQKLLEKTNFIIKEVEYFGWGTPFSFIDKHFRQFKWGEEFFELGRYVCKSQALALFFVCTKKGLQT